VLKKPLRLHRLHQMKLKTGGAGSLLVFLTAIRGHCNQSRAGGNRVASQSRGERVAIAVG
jgi:hypothetical protein